jgi:hypothetical protein
MDTFGQSGTEHFRPEFKNDPVQMRDLAGQLGACHVVALLDRAERRFPPLLGLPFKIADDAGNFL